MKFITQNIYFTSDLHFFHKNVIKYSNRPFVDVEEMNQAIIDNINSTVGENDHLYILGDVTFSANEDQNCEMLSKIKCKNLYLIEGNHDKVALKSQKFRSFFKFISNYAEIRVQDLSLKEKYQKVQLFHFPILEWNQGHRGSWMLHGHTHGNINYPEMLLNKKIMDVGVDCNQMKPFSYQEIKEIFKNRENITHHDD